jgi:phosphoribosylaminoimidazole-succinocarboxamide synthase
MARRKKVYEGKAKILYEGPEPGTLIQYFKDDNAPTVAAPAMREGKGVLNNRLSEFFMAGLNQIGVPTHFIRRINMREQLVRMAEIIPLEVVVRNFAAGPLSARLGIPEGTQLPRPIVEYYFKDDKLQLPLVAEEHIVAFNWASQQDLDDIVALSLRVNDFLSGVMMGVGIRLADFRHRGRPHLGGRLHAPDRRRRDQPRQLPSVGHAPARTPRRHDPRSRSQWPTSIPNLPGGWASCPRTSPIRRSRR